MRGVIFSWSRLAALAVLLVAVPGPGTGLPAGEQGPATCENLAVAGFAMKCPCLAPCDCEVDPFITSCCEPGFRCVCLANDT
jgi:hypothetical protein